MLHSRLTPCSIRKLPHTGEDLHVFCQAKEVREEQTHEPVFRKYVRARGFFFFLAIVLRYEASQKQKLRHCEPETTYKVTNGFLSPRYFLTWYGRRHDMAFPFRRSTHKHRHKRERLVFLTTNPLSGIFTICCCFASCAPFSKGHATNRVSGTVPSHRCTDRGMNVIASSTQHPSARSNLRRGACMLSNTRRRKLYQQRSWHSESLSTQPFTNAAILAHL